MGFDLRRILIVLVMLALILGCTVKPRVSGSYYGAGSSSGVEGAGSLKFSQPF